MKTCDELIREWGELSGGTPEQHIYDYFVKRERSLNDDIQVLKNQYKESCYVIGKISIQNTNLTEENNRLAVVVSAQEKEIKELEEQIDSLQ